MAAGDRNDNPYDDAGGFGKARKHFNRKQRSTPYDRPPTAVRNPSLAATTNNANGWLSKFVDPAQRLITFGAHKLFASVFRKRLPPPPPPQLPESEANFGASNSQEAVRKDSHGMMESAVDRIDSLATSSDRDGLTEVEFMLKQKTFTKSEIARLTDLLQSRTVDLSVGIQEKISEVIPSKPVLSRESKEVAITPFKDNGHERNGISTPITSASVLDEEVATPADLAKSYMGSRPSEVSPPVLGLRGRAIGEDSVTQFSQPFPSKSPLLSVAPRSSVHTLANENGFMTPRSLGRSAIYNMARTPYSRLRLTSTPQGTRPEVDVFGAPSSSSQIKWESGFSGSKQGVLKRRSSVFDSDIGSVGPIRRIRQKSNLLPSSGTLSIRRTGIVSDGGRRPSSSQKEALIRETKTENGDDMAHASGTSSVPSKSREVASQILQKLDVLVSCRDKSPTKMSPSGLRGQALRSLENVESSKFLETVQDDKKLDITPGGSLSDTQKPVFQKEDKGKGNSSVKPLTSNEKLASLSNGVDPPKLLKTNPSDVKSTSPGLVSVAQTPPQKKRAFQMSAHEDFLELDDDDHSDETTSATLSTEKAAKVGGAVADNKNTSTETSVFEKAAALSKGQNQSISMLNQKAPGSSDGIAFSDKNTPVTVTAASLSGVSSKEAVIDSPVTVTSKKASPPKELNVVDAPVFSFATKAVSTKEQNGFPPVDFNSKPPVAVSTLPVVAGPVGTMLGAALDKKLDNSSSTMKPLSKEPESDKADGKNNLKATETMSAAAASISSPSTISMLSFTGMPASASTTNGSIPTPIPIPSASFADTPKLSNTVFGQISSSGPSNTTAANSNGISIPSSVSTSTPSFMSGSVFQFGSSSTSTLSSTSAATVVGPAESEKKETSSFIKQSSSPFGGSAGGSLFGSFSSVAAKSTGSSTFDGASSSSAFGATTSSGLFSFSAGGNASAGGGNPFTQAAGGIFGSSNQTTPIQFGSSTSALSFGLTPSSAALPSGSSLFSSTGSTTSAANPVSSASATNATLSSSFPVPTFGSAFAASSSPSTGFTFGATAAAANAPSGQVFNFNSAATTTPSLPVFSSKPNSPVFAFGSSSPGNNDQMNMEDSMAEDTVQATTSTAPPPVFGQPPASTAFVFGSATPAGGNLFPAASSSGENNNNNPFQFGSQSNVANQSPFQASGSLEFNAGGSFSLGTTGDKSGRRFVKVKKNRKK